MNLDGFSGSTYEQWLRQRVAKMVGLDAGTSLVVCWGTNPPPEAKGVVMIPKDSAFLETPEPLKRWASPDAAASGLTVTGGAVPTVSLRVDILSWIGWFVSRAEEYDAFDCDVYGRFPRSASMARKLGLTECPIADMLELRLRRAIELISDATGIALMESSPWPNGKKFAVCLTHDVDFAIRRSLVAGARRLGYAAFKMVRGDVYAARKFFLESLGLAVGGRYNPYWASDVMARAEDKRGFRSAFYLLPHHYEWAPVFRKRGYADRRYDIRRPEIIDKFCELAKRGWEIGLHIGHDAHEALHGVGDAWQRLRYILRDRAPLTGARGHFLRFTVPETWRELARVGAAYDSTVAWSDPLSFRSGTSWPYRPFDRHTGQVIPIWELGVHVMDATVTDLPAMVEISRRVLDRTAETGGCACLLYHPFLRINSLVPITIREFVEAYETVLDTIGSRDDVWVATPRDVVQHMERGQ